MELIESKIIKIDSSVASSYNNIYMTSFDYNLKNQISLNPNQNMTYSVLNASIPYSFQAVNKYNQYLDIKENNVIRTEIISAGNYSALEYASQLKILLNKSNNYIYNVIYNKTSNKFIITCSNESYFLFKTGPNKNESIYKFLGSEKDDILINSNGWASVNSIIMNEIYYLQIKTDLGNFLYSSSTDLDGDNIMEIIPINCIPLGIILYNPTNIIKYNLSSKNISNIKISLCDNYGHELNLNGVPFLLTIKIDIFQNNKYINARDSISNEITDEYKTNIQYFVENPSSLIIPKQQDEMNNYLNFIEYKFIKQMLKELKKSKA